eukprot:jgi/Tetstr1/463456/TSEL_008349.t1
MMTATMAVTLARHGAMPNPTKEPAVGVRHTARGGVLLPATSLGKWAVAAQARYSSSFGIPPSGDGSRKQEEASETRSEDGDADVTKAQLLAASIPHVKNLGWSQAAIVAGAKDLGLSPSIGGLLERGEAELVEHVVKQQNAEFISKLEGLQAGDLQGMRMGDKMYTALKMRLEMNIPYIDSWPQALAVLTQPQNAPHSLALLTNLVDDIWHTLGDRSVDMSWYTKRGLLAGIYVSTELYMLTDSSPDFHDTWEALQRRLDDVESAGGAVREFSKQLERLFGSAGFPSTAQTKPSPEGASQTQSGADSSRGSQEKETSQSEAK